MWFCFAFVCMYIQYVRMYVYPSHSTWDTLIAQLPAVHRRRLRHQGSTLHHHCSAHINVSYIVLPHDDGSLANLLHTVCQNTIRWKMFATKTFAKWQNSEAEILMNKLLKTQYLNGLKLWAQTVSSLLRSPHCTWCSARYVRPLLNSFPKRQSVSWLVYSDGKWTSFNKYFELKNLWGADGAPQTRTTC